LVTVRVVRGDKDRAVVSPQDSKVGTILLKKIEVSEYKNKDP